MHENTPLLSISNISKSFPGVKALSDVSIDVQAGEVLALVGENGAGKSTLIKILSGVYKPDAGEIKINSDEVNFRTPIDAEVPIVADNDVAEIIALPAAVDTGTLIITQENAHFFYHE